MAIVRLLRSPRFALAVIGYVAAWCAAGAWLPWSLPGGAPPPAWAARIGLDHPFVTVPFLLGVALLFASLLACTWGKRGRVLRLQRGELPPSALRLDPRPGVDPEPFLVEQGFRRRGERWLRLRGGLWGGWVLHVGLLALVVGVLVQQSLFDTGLFELTEGQTLRLDAPEALRWRQHGLLAPTAPPPLEATLHWFDAYARQEGFAPDRLSQVGLLLPGHARVTAWLDRAAGVRVGVYQLFHAIPTGFALVLDVPAMGRRSVHLRQESPNLAAVSLTDPAGRPARLLLTSERRLDDANGTGAIVVEIEQGGARRPLQRNVPFRFGDADATLVAVSRWGQYTYVRAPGMSAVFAGFALVLLGCALLLLPAGVARIDPGGGAVRVAVQRGAASLAAAWSAAPDVGRGGETRS